jgi:hypothetical protein
MYLDAVKARFAELKLAPAHEVVPCTHDEIAVLEHQLALTLPAVYQEFLLWMGHSAGGFLRGSSCFYRQLVALQTAAVDLLNENQFPTVLPPDAFVFFMHQGYQFNFFRWKEGDNPSVCFYGEGTTEATFSVIYPTFSAFLAVEIEDHAKLMLKS